MLFGIFLNLPILLQIGFAFILHIVIKSHDNLLRILKFLHPDGHRLKRYRPRIIMRHAMMWRDCNEVSRFYELPLREADGVFLDDFLGEGLSRGGVVQGGKNGGRGRVFHLSVKDFLIESGTGREWLGEARASEQDCPPARY